MMASRAPAELGALATALGDPEGEPEAAAPAMKITSHISMTRRRWRSTAWPSRAIAPWGCSSTVADPFEVLVSLMRSLPSNRSIRKYS